MSQTEEEIKKGFLNIDQVKLSKKVREAMLQIVLNDDTEESEFLLYKHILENFSNEELANIAKYHIAQKLAKEVKEDPKTRELLGTIKYLNDLKKQVNGEISSLEE